MLNINQVRRQFPALNQQRDGALPSFFDGPAGTQVPRHCINAMVGYLSACNANCGGFFATSRDSDEILAKAHEGVAALLNASDPDEIIFGPNMTTLTLHLARALGKILQPSDEILVTRLDHDANIRPWILAAKTAGAQVNWVDIRPHDCTLDMEDFQGKLSEKTRLVSVTAASNLTGSKTDVAGIVQAAHDAGAWVFVDAVHYAPHALIDVQAWDCDFLACSAYKFFGPHVGILWGRRSHLESLPQDRLKPAPSELPHAWMTGTQNHEGLAGLVGTLLYLSQIADEDFTDGAGSTKASVTRRPLMQSFQLIHDYETSLAEHLLTGLAELPKLKIWGLAELKRIDQRVPTISITHQTKSPPDIARYLASKQIQVWSGNNYAVELTDRLGLEGQGGVVRIGLVHYNTIEEIDRLLEALREIG